MTVAFQSFGRSPFGAFVKSPLGARGDGVAAQFVIRDGLDYYTSDATGTVWTAHTIPGVTIRPLVGMHGTRVFLSNRYTDDFTTLNSYTGDLATIGRIYKYPTYSRWWSTPTGRIAYSDNNGTAWTERFGSVSGFDPPVPFGHVYRTADGTGDKIQRLSSGRLAFRVISTNAGARYFSMAYSDDNGVNWFSGTTGILLGASTGRVTLYVRGDVFYMVSSVLGVTYSTIDGGDSWTLVTSSVGASDFDTDVWEMTNPRLITALPQEGGTGNEFYTDDDFANVSAIGAPGLGPCYVKDRTTGRFYTFIAPSSLYYTEDGATLTLIATDASISGPDQIMVQEAMYQ